MIAKYSRAVLTSDLPEHGLKSGDVGTVVYVYCGEQAYEVEFFRLDGATAAVATVRADELRAVSADDVTHARSLTGGAEELPADQPSSGSRSGRAIKA